MAGLKGIPLVFCALAAGLSSAGCERGFEPTYAVEGDLQVQVDAFREEAAIRGHALTITNLILKYDPELALPTCGTCNSHSQSNDVQKVISINPRCPITYNEDIEALVFHEMGHCILGREHDADSLPNGDPRSIMIPGNYRLYSPCVYQIGNEDCNYTFKRDYYLDELFDRNTPVPDWAR